VILVHEPSEPANGAMVNAVFDDAVMAMAFLSPNGAVLQANAVLAEMPGFPAATLS